MNIYLREIIDLYKTEDVNSFLKSVTGINLDEDNLTIEKITSNYRFVGNEISNASIIDLLSDSGKGLIERITNSVDAVIEKQKISNNSKNSLHSIMIDAFPKYSAYRNNIIKSKHHNGNTLKALDAENQVRLVINDGTKGSLPSIDIIDQGIGIKGKDFKSTVLSLHGGNKINTNKSYLIGSFGQGGSTSLSFSESTMIISKKDDKLYFTIVKRAQIRDIKSHVYCYLVNDDGDPFELSLEYNIESHKYINEFLNSESGTMVRMIDTQLERKYRGQDVTKATGLIDYLNTELFDIKIPIKVIDNRPRFNSNKSYQNRNAMGSMMKLRTTTHVMKEYSGTHEVKVGNCYIDVNYYVILPSDENDWGSEKKCMQKYKEFNNHDKPIFYTVNGQYITGESMTKLNNGGLNFLKYRLMVHIDLDKLGKDKYKFFTTDRSRIKKVDNSAKLLEDVVNKLTHDSKLIEINEIIGKKSLDSKIDNDLLDEIKNDIKNDYRDFLNSEGIKRSKSKFKKNIVHDEIELYNYINKLDIITKRKTFYRNEQINIKLQTSAYKNVNTDTRIDAFINNMFYSDIETNIKNGSIIYDFTSLDIGKYNLQFQLVQNPDIISDVYEFEVIDQLKRTDTTKKINTGDIDFDMDPVNDANLICQVIKNNDNKLIRVYICLNHELLENVFLNYTSSKVDEIKRKIIKPIALFGLLYKNYYKIDNDDKKNEIMLAYIQTVIKLL